MRQIAQGAPIFLPFGLRHLRAVALRQLPSTSLIPLHRLGQMEDSLALLSDCRCMGGMKNLHEQYEGLVFDMDGTLADTMPTHLIAWTRTMEVHGLELTEERFWSLGGVPAPVIIEMLAAEQGVEGIDIEEVAEEKERLFIELLADVKPVGPVYEIAKAHKDLMPMAIATGSPTWMAEKILNALGVREWFGAVVAAEDVENPKPAPDIFRKAAELIGVDPARCHAFEDADLGVKAARLAGMTVVNIYDLLD